MIQKPRPFTQTFFNGRELFISIVQGLFITMGTLSVYQWGVSYGLNENTIRAMVFTTLVAANIFLTLVNRSFYYSVFTTLRYKNQLVLLIVSTTVIITSLLLLVPALNRFFLFDRLDFLELSICAGVGFISVIWFEGVKWWKRAST